MLNFVDYTKNKTISSKEKLDEICTKLTHHCGKYAILLDKQFKSYEASFIKVLSCNCGEKTFYDIDGSIRSVIKVSINPVSIMTNDQNIVLIE